MDDNGHTTRAVVNNRNPFILYMIRSEQHIVTYCMCTVTSQTHTGCTLHTYYSTTIVVLQI